ncbi:MAG: CvpA family protein [Synergistaceae bacterium]|nr:CvpA family protein [Synergistaceae bacterium]
MNNISIGLIVDAVIGIVFIFFLWRGLVRGFSGEIIGLVGLFAGVFCAWKFLDPATDLAMRYLGNTSIDRTAVSLVCAVAIFFTVEIIFAIIGWVLSMLVQVTQLSVTDHFFGMFIGLLKTCFVILFIYGVAETFSPVLPSDWMKESYTMKAAAHVWPFVRDFLQSHNILDFTKLTGGM